MHYRDFAIRIRNFQRQHVNVEVLQSPVDQMRVPVMVAYDETDLTRSLNKLEYKGICLPNLIALGAKLADLLLPDPVRTMLLRSLDLLREDEGLRLRLIINQPALANLPWEYVYLKRSAGEKGIDGFLALDPRISLVRHEAMDRPSGSVAATRPLKLVVGLASPVDQMPLSLQQERSYLEAALAAVDGIAAHFIEPLTVEKLAAALPDAHIVHFAGHGTFAPHGGDAIATHHLAPVADPVTDQPSPTTGVGMLIFEDASGNSYPFPAIKLAQNLATVRVVVLGACETGRRDGVNIWSGVAPALMSVGVPAAVAMQYDIYDQSTIAFARRFYGALSIGLSLDEAVIQGRLAILNLKSPFDLDFGVPVFYLRAPDGVIFPALAEDTMLEEARHSAQLIVQQRMAELHGKLTGVVGKELRNGEVAITQDVNTVAAGGEQTGAVLGQVSGGQIKIEQKDNRVEAGGNVTGVSIDCLG